MTGYQEIAQKANIPENKQQRVSKTVEEFIESRTAEKFVDEHAKRCKSSGTKVRECMNSVTLENTKRRDSRTGLMLKDTITEIRIQNMKQPGISATSEDHLKDLKEQESKIKI